MGGALALDGGDPRVPSTAGKGFGDNSVPSRAAVTKLHDSSVTFEEYMHYAAITRADERNMLDAPKDDALKVAGFKKFNPFKGTKASSGAIATVEVAEKEAVKDSESTSPNRPQPMVITDEEYIQASRAVRTATW